MVGIFAFLMACVNMFISTPTYTHTHTWKTQTIPLAEYFSHEANGKLYRTMKPKHQLDGFLYQTANMRGINKRRNRKTVQLTRIHRLIVHNCIRVFLVIRAASQLGQPINILGQGRTGITIGDVFIWQFVETTNNAMLAEKNIRIFLPWTDTSKRPDKKRSIS